jgi:hypothetical protein
MENKIDVLKYGFKIYENDGMAFVYRRYFNKSYVELVCVKNFYSLHCVKPMPNEKEPFTCILASRYKVESQEQLDFLIFNCRFRDWFGVEF